MIVTNRRENKTKHTSNWLNIDNFLNFWIWFFWKNFLSNLIVFSLQKLKIGGVRHPIDMSSNTIKLFFWNRNFDNERKPLKLWYLIIKNQALITADTQNLIKIRNQDFLQNCNQFIFNWIFSFKLSLKSNYFNNVYGAGKY